jgi:hypothetical protein
MSRQSSSSFGMKTVAQRKEEQEYFKAKLSGLLSDVRGKANDYLTKYSAVSQEVGFFQKAACVMRNWSHSSHKQFAKLFRQIAELVEGKSDCGALNKYLGGATIAYKGGANAKQRWAQAVLILAKAYFVLHEKNQTGEFYTLVADQLAEMLDVKLYKQDGWTNTKTKATTLGFLYPDDGDSYVEHFKIVEIYTQERINTYENRRASSGERFGKSYLVRFHRDLCHHLKGHISYWHKQKLFFPDLPDLPDLPNKKLSTLSKEELNKHMEGLNKHMRHRMCGNLLKQKKEIDFAWLETFLDHIAPVTPTPGRSASAFMSADQQSSVREGEPAQTSGEPGQHPSVQCSTSSGSVSRGSAEGEAGRDRKSPISVTDSPGISLEMVGMSS